MDSVEISVNGLLRVVTMSTKIASKIRLAYVTAIDLEQSFSYWYDNSNYRPSQRV